MNDQPVNARPPAQTDTRYLLIVGILMLLIVVSLAVLWVTERNRRLTAETRAANAAATQQKIQGLLGQAVFGGGQGSARPIDREDILTIGEATLDGRQVRALTVKSDAGWRVGLRPGDVLIVAEESPATAPAGAESAPR